MVSTELRRFHAVSRRIRHRRAGHSGDPCLVGKDRRLRSFRIAASGPRAMVAAADFSIAAYQCIAPDLQSLLALGSGDQDRTNPGTLECSLAFPDFGLRSGRA